MKVDIYVSAKSSKKFLSVPSGTNVEKLKLPPDIDPDLLELKPSRKDVELNPSQPMLGLGKNEIADVIAQIEEKGYAIF